MIIYVHIGDTVGATADGKLLRALPMFAPSTPGDHEMDTAILPKILREQVEAEVRGLMVEVPSKD